MLTAIFKLHTPHYPLGKFAITLNKFELDKIIDIKVFLLSRLKVKLLFKGKTNLVNMDQKKENILESCEEISAVLLWVNHMLSQQI